MFHCYLLLYFILEFNIYLLICDRGFNRIFELLILLSRPLKCWDHRHVPPSPVTEFNILNAANSPFIGHFRKSPSRCLDLYRVSQSLLSCVPVSANGCNQCPYSSLS